MTAHSLLTAVAHLPPFRLDGAGRVSLATYADRTDHPEEQALVDTHGPHPVAALRRTWSDIEKGTELHRELS